MKQRPFIARLLASKRARGGAFILALLLFVAVFADFLAGDAPLVAFGGENGVAILPGLVHPTEYARETSDEQARTFAGAHAVWPLVRSGPEKESDAVLESPSGSHPLGTDEHGRDLFARLVFGIRHALGLSLVAVLASLALGSALGGAAAFVSRAWDARLERLAEIVATFPLIIMIALVRSIETTPSALSLVLAVALVRWAEVARLVRAEVFRSTAEDYVLAARAMGGSRTRIFRRHIFPNAVGPVLVSSVFGIASIVLVESAVSFLAIGKPSPAASWGETLAEAARHPSDLRLLLWPALLLLVTVGASYLVADSLRDAIDAKTPANEPRPSRSP